MVTKRETSVICGLNFSWYQDNNNDNNNNNRGNGSLGIRTGLSDLCLWFERLSPGWSDSCTWSPGCWCPISGKDKTNWKRLLRMLRERETGGIGPPGWAWWWWAPWSTAGSPPCHCRCCWRAVAAELSRADPASVHSLWRWPSPWEKPYLRQRHHETIQPDCPVPLTLGLWHTCVVWIKLLKRSDEMWRVDEQLFPQSLESGSFGPAYAGERRSDVHVTHTLATLLGTHWFKCIWIPGGTGQDYSEIFFSSLLKWYKFSSNFSRCSLGPALSKCVDSSTYYW